ncbi:MAG: 3,4-dihydroxy-2-butanone-4-phosphate synthase [Dehalococcoidia bacterium]|nr:3,4-dihydroxy-2-butanone-4-phosphate synthase [Dehalococcoidia bacterium]
MATQRKKPAPVLVDVPQAVEEFRNGRMVIIVDDENRENEGDVCVPGQFCTAEMINFMAMHARGLICAPLSGERLDALQVPLMTRRNSAPLGTAFTITVEAAAGVTTGISAADRARTVAVLADPDSTPQDLTRPGHIFPLRARDGGVLVRAGQTEASVDLCRMAGLEPVAVVCEVMKDDGTMARMPDLQVLADPDSRPGDLTRPGHIFPLRARDGGTLVRAGQTEASVDLCRLAGLEPAAVVCEVIKDDGTMARMPDLKRFARKHDLKIVTVADIIAYRLAHERLVERVDESELPTRFGNFRVIAYRTLIDTKEHIVLTMGDVSSDEPTLVRVHDQCVTGDVFSSMRCDCGEQLEAAMERVAREGRGAIVYMDQEGRGIGLHNKIRAYRLQDEGMDTAEANEALDLPIEAREYGIGAQILVDLGLRKLRLMTNNPTKIKEIAAFGEIRGVGLEGYGLEVTERVPLETPANPHNVRYLITKRDKMGHLLEQEMPGAGPG